MTVQEKVVQVTLKGNPVTLLGSAVKVGQQAPDCVLVANDLSEKKLTSFKGKICILSVVPSLDTPICDLQTKRFNQEATQLGSGVIILTISMDLPMAQKRWCGATGSSSIITLSDHREGAFGKAFGVLIKDLRLLARSIFILDSDGKIRYSQICKEITQEPDYADALKAVKSV